MKWCVVILRGTSDLALNLTFHLFFEIEKALKETWN
jgi:hypothetical protein